MKFPYRVITQQYLAANKSKSYLVNYIRNRLLRRDGHIILVITGETGSGKSEAGLKICEKVDPYFDSQRVSFSVKQYSDHMKQPFPRGSAFMFEEAQHSASNLNFHSASNKALFSLLSTFRHRNYLTVVTLPFQYDFDKKSKRLRHIDIKMTGTILIKEGVSKAKLYFPKQSDFKDKTYLNKMRVKDKFGRKEISEVWFKRPSKKLRENYLKDKMMFTTELSKTVSLSLEENQAKKFKKMVEGKA